MRKRLHRRPGVPQPQLQNFAQVDAYGKSSMENTIADAIRVMQILNPALDVKGDGEVEKEIEEIEHTK